MASSNEKARNSGDAAAPSATDTRVAEGAAAHPEDDEASVAAGEPEAPVAPAPHADEHDSADEPVEHDSADEPDEHDSADEHGADEQPAEVQDEPEDHERKLEHDLEELTARAQKADEYLELAQRTRADFENYRKRAAREVAAAEQRGVVKLVRELLPAVDNLDRAVDAVEAADGSSNGDELASGIKLVHAEVIAALARAGVERFSPERERFDPEQHEAVAQQPVDGADSGTIVEVYQRGYRLGDAVIRPARVLVAG